MFRSSLSIAVIAATCAGLLVLTQAATHERIDNNTRERELRLVSELAGTLPPASGTWSSDVWDFCNGTVLARAESAGYGGALLLMIAINRETQIDQVRGLRILKHQETPGLADFLGQPDQGWLARLVGSNRAQIGALDTLTGATITSRAVQRGVLLAMSRTQQARQTLQACER